MTFTARRAVAADQLPEVCADLVQTERARLVAAVSRAAATLSARIGGVH